MLECRSNEVGRFLLCLVRDVETKKYCLVFLEGKGLVGGWFLLAKKLRALGVSTPALSKVYLGVPTSNKEGCSVKGIEKGLGTFAEVGRKKTGELKESFMGAFRGSRTSLHERVAK